MATNHRCRARGSWYNADWIDCIRCGGDGRNVECFDDLCHAQNRCMHGNNTCALCAGLGRITKELRKRWWNREPFESVTAPDADLRARGKLHVVARERRQTTSDEGGDCDGK